MTGVVELLAAAGESAPVQRVRNYHLADREASPRPRDYLTAMRKTDGEVCLRWPGPPGECFVRYADPGWELAERNRFRGRQTVDTVPEERVREWLRDGRPELVAHEEVREAFVERCAPDASLLTDTGTAAVADGGPVFESPSHVRVERYADLLAVPELDRTGAEALASALPAGRDEIAFRLPLVLAEEIVLEPVAGSDRVFVAEPVPEHETNDARYVRQDRRGCWVPKAETTVYELVEGATVDRDSSERPESA